MELNWRKDAESLEEVKRLSEAESDLTKENKAIFCFGFTTGMHHEYWKDASIYFRPPNEYPDAVLFRERTNQVLNVEFESVSSNFKRHGHDPKKCDLIVCLFDDYKEVCKEDCPIPVWSMFGGIRFPERSAGPRSRPLRKVEAPDSSPHDDIISPPPIQ